MTIRVKSEWMDVRLCVCACQQKYINQRIVVKLQSESVYMNESFHLRARARARASV